MTSLRSESFCGTLPSFTWSSDSNEILIQFKTDTMIQAGGFSVIGAAAVLPAKAVVGGGRWHFRISLSSKCKMLRVSTTLLKEWEHSYYHLIMIFN